MWLQTCRSRTYRRVKYTFTLEAIHPSIHLPSIRPSTVLRLDKVEEVEISWCGIGPELPADIEVKEALHTSVITEPIP